MVQKQWGDSPSSNPLIVLYFYRSENLCRETNLCPLNMPSFAKIKSNASLIICNSITTLENPVKPKLPNVINAGGLHIKPQKSLPLVRITQ